MRALFLTLTLCCSHFAYAQALVGEKSELKLTLNRVFTLSDSLESIGGLPVFDALADGNFATSSWNAIPAIHDGEGFQRRTIGRDGAGPGEFLNPFRLSAFKDTLAVWDSRTRRFTLINFSSGKVYSTIDGFRQAIDDFVLTKNYLVLYTTVGFQANLVRFYDLAKGRFVEAVGRISTELRALRRLDGQAGWIAEWQGRVYYVRPDKKTVWWIDLTDFSKGDFQIDDSKFVDTPFGGSLSSRDDLSSYMSGRSAVVGILGSDNFLVVQIQDNPGPVNNDLPRELRLYFYNRSHDLVDNIIVPNGFDTQPFAKFTTSFGDCVFMLNIVSPDEGETVENQVQEWCIDAFSD